MASLQSLFSEYWPHLAFLLSLVVGGTAAVHAAMTKNDVRAAIGWVGVILMSPLLGPFFYLVAGVNRIRHDHISEQRNKSLKESLPIPPPPRADIGAIRAPQFDSLRVLGDRISRFPLCDGNHIRVLRGGDQAYPAMIEAIDAAASSIALETYIFDNDSVGRQIVDALARAQQRGVNVRVLIDAVGSKYSRPPIIRLLRKKGVPSALFMTNPLGLRMPYANLRSHRKILVVDGRIAFTGGMNIRAGFTTDAAGAKTAMDTHFLVEGPVVLQLMSVFAHDWEFTTKENLAFKAWCSDRWDPPQPLAPARCIRSGPDRNMVGTHNMLLGAFAVAQRHIRIQSPYFLPDQVLMGAINTAARRGITVDIVIPGQNNLRLVNYAMTAQLDQVIHSGCRVWRARGNFNHSKLITIDGAWSYVGSSNLDPRSLRLNFELDMEIYSRETAAEIESLIDAEIRNADAVTLESLAAIPFRKRLRNRVIWLASPYL
ncbi:phospholipase D-like domain-containing protein [Parapusillimonas granuli]|uniref:PLDc N-terminal domain-containing protein n=1 Tax=Parapusillimonas granuli TaxID=380911 RepID=A0A853G0J5_9BURK|nr:phospholipase D-like domain-containing protein [Parapusillimonas granuli]MBB5213746.1 cardiolipin synthase [Parapusillimonas granuli]MEB2398822.1 phospholipase D-like domain-containing protein [Alcaligenaceae bacterium]NYT48580.1 PLDc N-terminal domain-containing protein [Parapusillimonas granuli]